MTDFELAYRIARIKRDTKHGYYLQVLAQRISLALDLLKGGFSTDNVRKLLNNI